MVKLKTTDVMTKVVGLLTPLSSEERQRVTRAALTLLGETKTEANGGGHDEEGVDTEPLHPRAKSWLRQNGIELSQLQQVFHLHDGKAEVIASAIPGKGAKGQTINAYVLQGLSQLLSSGEPSFDDKSARKLCQTLGCYNPSNHTFYIGAKGNKMIGSKENGWRLTAPGQTHGANLIKDMMRN